MADLVIVIDMDRRCAECGAMGVMKNGLCIKCTAKRVAGWIRDEAKKQKEEIRQD